VVEISPGAVEVDAPVVEGCVSGVEVASSVVEGVA